MGDGGGGAVGHEGGVGVYVGDDAVQGGGGVGEGAGCREGLFRGGEVRESDEGSSAAGGIW